MVGSVSIVLPQLSLIPEGDGVIPFKYSTCISSCGSTVVRFLFPVGNVQEKSDHISMTSQIRLSRLGSSLIKLSFPNGQAIAGVT
jgi:hypothetical protein